MNRISSAALIIGQALAVLVLAGCSQPYPADGSASATSVPGATGRTIVPGSNSTVAGDAGATEQQQKSPLGGRR